MRPLSLDAIPVGMLFANVSLAATSVVPIIAPSANLNGIIIRTLGLWVGPATNAGASIYADTVAPSTYNDATKRVIFGSAQTANSGSLYTVMPHPVYLYPGMGLWVGGDSATTGAVNITYDLLTPEGR